MSSPNFVGLSLIFFILMIIHLITINASVLLAVWRVGHFLSIWAHAEVQYARIMLTLKYWKQNNYNIKVLCGNTNRANLMCFYIFNSQKQVCICHEFKAIIINRPLRYEYNDEVTLNQYVAAHKKLKNSSTYTQHSSILKSERCRKYEHK